MKLVVNDIIVVLRFRSSELTDLSDTRFDMHTTNKSFSNLQSFGITADNPKVLIIIIR